MSLSSKDFKTCCRWCLKTVGDMTSVFEPGLRDMLLSVTSLTVCPTDPFPKRVCKRCVRSMAQADTFRRAVLSNHKQMIDSIEAGSVNPLSPIPEKTDTIMNMDLETVEDTTNGNNEVLITMVNPEEIVQSEQHNNITSHSNSNDSEKETEFSVDRITIRDNEVAESKIIVIDKVTGENRLISNYLGNAVVVEEQILGPLMADKTGIEQETEIDSTNDNVQGPLMCSLCRQIFLSVNEFKSHEVRHREESKPERPYLCVKCGKQYKFATSLQRHWRRHDGGGRQCHVCSKRFTYHSSLAAHMTTHTGARAHSCKDCGRAYSQLAALNRHRRRRHRDHTQGPYGCNACTKYFYQEESLRRHENTHRKVAKKEEPASI